MERAIHRVRVVLVVERLYFSILLRVVLHAIGGDHFLVAEPEDDPSGQSSARTFARRLQLDLQSKDMPATCLYGSSHPHRLPCILLGYHRCRTSLLDG